MPRKLKNPKGAGRKSLPTELKRTKRSITPKPEIEVKIARYQAEFDCSYNEAVNQLIGLADY